MTLPLSVKKLLRAMLGSRFLLILSLAPFVLLAQPPSGYYNTASGLTGQDLQIALHNIIKSHTVVSYTPGVWNAFYTTDVRNGDKIWDIYSDVPSGTLPYEYTVGSSQCGTATKEGDCYSREHSFPSSYFGGASPMYTDIHHIFPVDQYVNATGHSNYPFSTVSAPVYTSLNGSKRGPSSFPGYIGTAFEPIDAYKGDIARAYFYMATRYRDLIQNWSANASYADAILNETAYPAFESWFLNLLYTWHTADPVSQKEIDRNNAIFAIQNNRNPFIDHPEYVMQVWFPSGPVAEPSQHPTAFTAQTGTPPFSAVQLSWTDAAGEVLPAGYLLLGSTEGFEAIEVPADGTPVADGLLSKNVAYGTQSYTFTNLQPSVTYYFKAFPYTNAGVLIDYKTDETIPSASVATTEGATNLQPGDIAIVQYQASNPDGFSFITFTQIAAGTVINFTDNGFASDTEVRTGEGFLSYTAPAVIPVGTVIAWYNGMDISGTGFSSGNPSNFSLATAGDQIMVYQGAWNSNPSLIYAINFGDSDWLSSGNATANTSYLPSSLQNNVTAVSAAAANGYYSHQTSGTVSALKSLIAYPSNWTSGSSIQTVPPFTFHLTNSTSLSQSASLLNLEIKAGETFTILPGIGLQVHGDIDNQAGTQGFIIASDEIGTAMLLHNTNHVPASVERYLPGASLDWHLLAAPVLQPFEDSDFVSVSGFDLYAYHEPSMLWVNYKNTENSPTFLEVNGPDFVQGAGYLVAYENVAAVRKFQGPLNNGLITTQLTTAASIIDYQGFVLAGNPYASAIDWKAASGWSREHLMLNGGGYDFWVYNESTGNYGTYNSALSGNLGTNGVTRYIPTGQGFFVRAASEGSLSMNNAVRIMENPAFLKNDQPEQPLISLRFTSPNGLSDELIVTFNTDGQIAGSPKLHSLNQQAPNCWIQNGNNLHSIHFAGITGPKVVPVHFEAAYDGIYSIKVPQLLGFPDQSLVRLTDMFTNTVHVLNNDTYLSFEAASGDPSARFQLEFAGSIGLWEVKNKAGFSASYANGMMEIRFDKRPKNGQISVIGLNGQLLYQHALKYNDSSVSFPLSLSSGVHIISYTTDSSKEQIKLVH